MLDTGTAGPDTNTPHPRQSPPGTGKGHQRWAGAVGGPGMQGVWLQMSAGLFRSSQEGCEPWRASEVSWGTEAFDRLVPTASILSPSGHPNQDCGSRPCCQLPRDRVLQSRPSCPPVSQSCAAACRDRHPGPWILKDLLAHHLSQIHPPPLAARGLPKQDGLAPSTALNPARFSTACCTKSPF